MITLTDEEIVCALECCGVYHSCDSCPFYEDRVKGKDCLSYVQTYALDLINRQKAEIERIQKARLKQAQFLAEQKLQKSELHDKLSRAKTEAYKEFSEKIKQEIKEAYDSNIEVLNEHFEKHRGCFNDTFVGIIEGKNNALLGLSDFIDNLLKEMVGKEE